MALTIELFKFKLDEIDKKINDWKQSAVGRAYQKCLDQKIASGSIFFGGSINAVAYIDGKSFPCDTVQDKYRYVGDLLKQRADLVKEMEKEAQFLKDQEILQQQQQTAQQENITKATEAAVQAALEQVNQAKGKTEQELLKAQQELAKAQAAMALAQKGDLESSKVLLGKLEPSNKNKIIFMVAASIVVLGAGFGAYKLFKR